MVRVVAGVTGAEFSENIGILGFGLRCVRKVAPLVAGCECAVLSALEKCRDGHAFLWLRFRKKKGHRVTSIGTEMFTPAPTPH
jgi:hypothetical protein